jgi:ATP-dependent RNA helicase MSS116
MGFHPDIDTITDFFPKTPIRQMFLFSATVSPQIRQVAREVIDKDHLFIDVVSKDTSPVHAHIPQHYTVLPNAKEQLPQLLHLIAHDQLANPRSSKVIVFLNTTKQTQLFATLFHQLSKTTLPARSQIYEIHLKRTQALQTAASNTFHRDRSGAAILVTSDVSAQGIDYLTSPVLFRLAFPHLWSNMSIVLAARAALARVGVLIFSSSLSSRLCSIPIRQRAHQGVFSQLE